MNWMVLEIDQSNGTTKWAYTFGSNDASTTLTSTAFTGELNSYERLYLVGTNKGTHNMLA